MKKFYFSLLTALLFSYSAIANDTVFVEGYVFDLTGAPAPNRQVKIVSCDTLTTFTDNSGFYRDTVYCSSPVDSVKVMTWSCQSGWIVITKAVPPSKTVVATFYFSVCVTPGNVCNANFNYSFSGGGVANFWSTSSTSAGSINSAQWNFGDGSTGSGNVTSHTYNAPGSYTVMLVINTSNGCVDSAVKVVTIIDSSHCNAQFYDSAVNGNKFFFFSQGSTAGPNNQIIQRVWKFGDGTGNSGNQAVVDHIYQQSGTYNVCLKIVTANGCIDSTCKTITVVVPNTSCVSNFSFQVINDTVPPFHVQFNSAASAGGPADAIISRFWTFGDGQQLSGNVVSPVHAYTSPGNYQVCLKITTASGCQKTLCKVVTITDSANCHANFSYSIGTAGAVHFTNTSSTLGTNAQYLWTFGNVTSTAVNPVHTFPPGTYNVCLKVFSAAGCIDSICKTITIAAPPPCFANFAYQVGSNGNVSFTNTSSTLGTGTQYMWSFGNGIFTTGVNATHHFQPGSYNVCLSISNANCFDSICKTIIIPPPATNCEAAFQFSGLAPAAGVSGYKVQFTSNTSHGVSLTDSIISRTWIWGDGSVTSGNIVSPQHTYSTAGVYNVCLVIASASGCSDTTCKTVSVPMQNQLICQSKFIYQHLPVTTNAGRAIGFNSSTSVAGPGDSIVSRKWTFGDGTPQLTGNNVSPVHVYLQPGTYNVCLTITTALGCTRTECKLVVVPQVAGNCVPHFTWSKTGPKQITFNSASSWVPVNDTIIERKWLFGDATPLLSGNVVSPVHQYLHNGIYTVLLKIRTVKQCEKTFYGTVVVQDSVPNPSSVDRIKIVSLYPTPATYQIQAVVWSLQNNIQAELAIYDIYGTKKWSTNKVLLSGNNVTVIPTGFLATGPYYLRVTTIFGVRSRAFFKQ